MVFQNVNLFNQLYLLIIIFKMIIILNNVYKKVNFQHKNINILLEYFV
jgi:hypothetical protein